LRAVQARGEVVDLCDRPVACPPGSMKLCLPGGQLAGEATGPGPVRLLVTTRDRRCPGDPQVTG
jgi:hypothetical protein